MTDGVHNGYCHAVFRRLMDEDECYRPQCSLSGRTWHADGVRDMTENVEVECEVKYCNSHELVRLLGRFRGPIRRA